MQMWKKNSPVGGFLARFACFFFVIQLFQVRGLKYNQNQMPLTNQGPYELLPSWDLQKYYYAVWD